MVFLLVRNGVQVALADVPPDTAAYRQRPDEQVVQTRLAWHWDHGLLKCDAARQKP
jgi:hypothetical protein